MIELLSEAASSHPDQPAVISPMGEVTYAELAAQAAAVATYLVSEGIQRFAIREPDPAVVLALLAGASRVGVEACVYPLNANESAVDDFTTRFDHEVLVTSGTGYSSATTDPATILATEPGPLPEQPESRPVLVMTTGTTGAPKGVRHEWGRLLLPTRRTVPTPEHRWLLAYGLNQFGGLQILIHMLAAQATLVAGEGFQPRQAITALRRWGVTHVSGTPTFWRFLITEIQSDGKGVPDIVQATVSGEAVPSALLQRIRDTFPSAKISQIYAATEFGASISVRDGLPGLPASMLEPGGDVEIKIVGDELHVRSRLSMLGYHGEEPVDADSWRATGDVVELVGDRVEFRGRRTDVINVGGVKVHPLPVEERASLVPGVAAARAFGRANALTGAVVALEIVLDPGYDADKVEDDVREACADLPPAARPRSIRFVEALATTGNKMSRGTT